MNVKAKHIRKNDTIKWVEGSTNVVEKVVTYADVTKIYFKENEHTYECHSEDYLQVI